MRKTIIVGATVACLFNAFAGGEDQKRVRPVDMQANDTTKTESGDVAEGRPGIGIKTIEVDEPEQDVWHRSTLTGNWNGTREMMGEGGVTFTLGYKADNISNLSGGLARRSSYLHNIDLLVAFDGGRLLNWKGGTFLIHAMSNNGEGFSRFIGDAQVASNIDAPKMTKLYQALVQQNLMDDRLSFLAGLYDLNSEFSVIRPARVFINKSLGVGKELSQTGQNGPSVFPTPSAALRVRIQPDDAVSFQFAAFDAVPGSPGDPTAPSLFMSSDDGALVIGEVSYSWSGIREENVGGGKYTVGAWFYTSAFEELHANAVTGKLVRSTANSGLYLMAEQVVYAETEEQGLALFTRLGFANGKINQYDYSLSAGAVYTGVFPDRDADKIGVAVTHANSSREYKRATLLGGSSVASGELALEFTYRARIAPWLAVQPDFQYIIHPGTDPLVGNAAIFGTRFEVGF